jgi:protein-S-isoprenylcysteine O-methyltransferase Ste14
MGVEWEVGASAIEFRLRMAINMVIIVLGFWSPWIEKWGVGSRISLLEWLALELSRTGLMQFTMATAVVILIGALIAGVGAALRVWGAAYLGPATVISREMKADRVMAHGPYRYVRNPLYLGLWCMVAAMALIMPPTGALFTILLLTIFLMRLILGEEAFLSAKLGEPYRVYLSNVPRLFPRLRTTAAHGTCKPNWMRAVLAEVLPVGVFMTFAFFSWSYDNRLMGRAILISFGVSLVTRAFVPGTREEELS